jgi:putative endonuclease
MKGFAFSLKLLRVSVDTIHHTIEKPNHNTMQYVYILKCSDNSFYTGCTNNIDNRLEHHRKGLVHYTKDKLPVELITFIAFQEKHKAYEFEKYLKSGSGIAFRNKRLV